MQDGRGSGGCKETSRSGRAKWDHAVFSHGEATWKILQLAAIESVRTPSAVQVDLRQHGRYSLGHEFVQWVLADIEGVVGRR